MTWALILAWYPVGQGWKGRVERRGREKRQTGQCLTMLAVPSWENSTGQLFLYPSPDSMLTVQPVIRVK
jgi:hypothetical protein